MFGNVAEGMVGAHGGRPPRVDFQGVGQISVGGFPREFENFFGDVVFLPTPGFLALYGLDANTYGPYEVATNHNVADTVRMTGAGLSYKPALTFLPRWARRVHVFGTLSRVAPVWHPRGSRA